MSKEYTKLRVWTKTLRKLKVLAEARGQTMITYLDRLIAVEYEKLPILHTEKGKADEENSNTV